MGDLLISVSDACIAYFLENWKMGTALKFLRKMGKFIRGRGLKRCLTKSLTMEVFPTDPNLPMARRCVLMITMAEFKIFQSTESCEKWANR